MAEGPLERSGRSQLPHLVVPWQGMDRAYRGRSAPQRRRIHAIADRDAHAGQLHSELETAHDQARAQVESASEDVRADGFALAVESWSDEPGYQLALQSLDANGARLLSVVPGTDQSAERAVVWLPFRAVERFFRRIDEYATQQTRSGNPKNLALVANIAELRLAVLHDLWQEPEQFPDPDKPRWWEVWLARFTVRDAPGAALRAIAAERAWPMVPETLTFPDNEVALVRTSATELATLLSTSATPSELHRARVTSEILRLDHSFQRDLVADLESRIAAARAESAAVCVLDTGVMSAHQLLRRSVDQALSALGDAGPADLAGHGTQMAGLALFGDLAGVLESVGAVSLRHRLESVKVIRDNHDTTTDPENYGTTTAAAAARVEIAQQRRRVFSMAVTADDQDGSDGRPTSWSASLDALAFGTDIQRDGSGVKLLSQPDPKAARLFVVSAGNVTAPYAADHLALCDLRRVQSPAQAWNVLTVGAYTEMVKPPSNAMFQGWTTVAPAGELSPFSRTSMTFTGSWPIKPDVVLEGGNLIVDPGGTMFDQHDDVSLLTTSNQPHAVLTTANATSAATAQAARLAAIAMEQYPSLWPETVRGLLVHAAEWTPAMQAQFRAVRGSKGGRVRLLRRYGWGVPAEAKVLSSASSSVTLIIQDEFLPFEAGSSGLSMRALRFHRLPWPREQLSDLFDATVRLRVTLSYFVEPNPSNRGWQGRYRYASHGLRFDVKRPTENLDEFERRLSNEAAQEEAGSPPRSSSPDDRWFVGSRLRNQGSLRADIWEGTGAQLAESDYIAVTPVGGWWKENNRRDRTSLPVRYALLVSLHTDAVGTDIYTPIATQIGIPVAIEA